MFLYTTAIDKMRSMDSQIKVIQGGTSSGKTHGIIPILINDAAAREGALIDHPRITIVNESLPASKDGPAEIFRQVMQETGRWFEERWLQNPMQYTFASGVKIQFKSFDTVGKAKAAGKRGSLFINECNHIPFPIADALMDRTMGDIWLDYNPDNEFWVHTDTLKNPKAQLLILNYLHNEACPQNVIDKLELRMSMGFHDPNESWDDKNNIKNKYWANWCKVYVKGAIGNLEGVVFENWEIIDSVPSQARYVGYGIDFGYTNDPTTIIDAYQYNDAPIFDELCFQNGMSNREIADKLKENRKHRGHWGVADCAEPKSIDEINRYGFSIKGSEKGKDSINFGISILQERKFYVTARSVNMIRELQRYKWATNREGQTLNIPMDKDNHTIDPSRYIAVEKFTSKKSGITFSASI